MLARLVFRIAIAALVLFGGSVYALPPPPPATPHTAHAPEVRTPTAPPVVHAPVVLPQRAAPPARISSAALVHGRVSVAREQRAAPVTRIEAAYDSVRTGQFPRDLSRADLESMQGHALRTLHRLFTDPHGDGALRAAVGSKLGAYEGKGSPDLEGMSKRPVSRQQLDALELALNTFKGTDDGDVALRTAALQKIAAMGTRADVAAIMPVVRKPPHSADLHNALQAVKSILARDGSPEPRGEAHLAPETRALLAKGTLTNADRAAVIKDVLSHGEIVKIDRNLSPTANAVYFLTFKETLPGPNGERVPIQAVWKEEGTFVGKQKPTFTREVAAYEFTQRISKSDIVPVTVEGVLSPDQIPGDNKPFGTGSIQYKVPGGESLGQGYPNSRLLKPKFEAFMRSPEGQKQLDEIRTHLFVLNDPEKLPNSGGYDVHNWGNILAAPDPSRPGGYKLYMIDNGTGQGALTQFGTSVKKDMLPDHPTAASAQLSHVPDSAVVELLAPRIGDTDAADVANRMKTATGR